MDLTAFGVVMTADSQPVEALDGQTRILGHAGRWHTRNPILVRDAGGFTGFVGYVGTEEIGRTGTRDWLGSFGARHPTQTLAEYGTALGHELTDEWQRHGLVSVLEILISGVETATCVFGLYGTAKG